MTSPSAEGFQEGHVTGEVERGDDLTLAILYRQACSELDALRAALQTISDSRNLEGYHTRQARALQLIADAVLRPPKDSAGDAGQRQEGAVE